MNTLLMSLMIMIMTHEMPKLPYANNALEPVISQQTIDYHYGKHLQTYVNNLNNLVPGTEYENKDLVTIVATAPDGAIFNNAGQVLNNSLRNRLKANPPGSWRKLSNVISVVSRTSRKSLMQRQSDYSARAGHGCR